MRTVLIALGGLAVLACGQSEQGAGFLEPDYRDGNLFAALAAGDVLVSEINSGTLRLIAPDGSSSSIFHSGIAAPRGIAVEANGDIVVVEGPGAGNLRRIAADGSSSAVFFTGLSGSSGIAVAASGDLIVTEDLSPNRLWRIAPDGSSSTVVALGIKSEAVRIDANGDYIVVQEFSGGQLLRVTPAGVVTVIFTGLSDPSDVAIEASGDFLVTEFGNGQVRRIASDGSTSSVVFTGLASLEGIDIALNGDLLVSERTVGRLRRIKSDGSSATVFFSGLAGPDQLVVLSRQSVSIDIKPGDEPNTVNCDNPNSVIAVAILSTPDFDATTVDEATVSFEGGGEVHLDPRTGQPRRHEEDVEGDNDTDLVFHFRLGETGLTCNSTQGTLSGRTFDGVDIVGTDVVNMIQ